MVIEGWGMEESYYEASLSPGEECDCASIHQHVGPYAPLHQLTATEQGEIVTGVTRVR